MRIVIIRAQKDNAAETIATIKAALAIILLFRSYFKIFSNPPYRFNV